MHTESFYTESGSSPPSRKESDRKYRESHRAQRRAYDRKRQQLPQVKARRNETARIRCQNRAIAFHEKHLGGGMPGLSISLRSLPRPKALTDLIIQESRRQYVEWWGLHGEHDHLDADFLLMAAEHIRDNPFYPVVVQGQEEMLAYYNEHGITNPWRNSWYLQKFPENSLKRKMQQLSSRLHSEVRIAQREAEQEAQRRRRIESGEEIDVHAMLASLRAQMGL